MQQRNFNLTFPICDALFGTSDLKRGLWGTLFNGNNEAYMDPQDRRRFDEYKGGKDETWPPEEAVNDESK